jgi:putative selenate reductase
MDAVGATSTGDFIIRSRAPGSDALQHTEDLVARATNDARYRHSENTKEPRKIGSHLELFDCITCDKCVPVCPNDANFTLPLPPRAIEIRKLCRAKDAWQEVVEGTFEINEKHQIASFADFCNDCGNCDVFCPEDGGPYVVKPRFFGSLEDFQRFPHLDGFHIEGPQEAVVMHARLAGEATRLERSQGGLVWSGEGFELGRSVAGTLTVAGSTTRDELDLTLLAFMEALLDAALSPERINYVNVPHFSGA